MLTDDALSICPSISTSYIHYNLSSSTLQHKHGKKVNKFIEWSLKIMITFQSII